MSCFYLKITFNTTGSRLAHEQEAVYKHRAQSKQEIDFNVGDSLSYIADHWDGYIYGRNCRTNQMGVYPSYKVRDKWNTY